MLLSLLTVPAVLMALATPAPAPPGAQRRCGWLSSPTPGSVWLRDRQGDWLLRSHGGYRARDIAALSPVAMPGCVCIDATVDRRNHRVEHLLGAEIAPPGQCRPLSRARLR